VHLWRMKPLWVMVVISIDAWLDGAMQNMLSLDRQCCCSGLLRFFVSEDFSIAFRDTGPACDDDIFILFNKMKSRVR
jgi:acyl-ACP thioesterase